VKLPSKNYGKLRVEIVDNSGHIAPAFDFYNTRLLNQLKKLLKERNVAFIWHKNPDTLIIDVCYLVIKPTSDGRFFAYNKMLWPKISYSFTANSTIELIVKLLRFKLITHTMARDLAKESKKKPKIPSVIASDFLV